MTEDDGQGIGDGTTGVLDSIRRRKQQTGLTSRGNGNARTRLYFRCPFNGEEKILFTFLSSLVCFHSNNLSSSKQLVGNLGNILTRFNSVSVSDKEEAVVPIGCNQIKFTMMQY